MNSDNKSVTNSNIQQAYNNGSNSNLQELNTFVLGEGEREQIIRNKQTNINTQESHKHRTQA